MQDGRSSLFCGASHDVDGGRETFIRRGCAEARATGRLVHLETHGCFWLLVGNLTTWRLTLLLIYRKEAAWYIVDSTAVCNQAIVWFPETAERGRCEVFILARCDVGSFSVKRLSTSPLSTYLKLSYMAWSSVD